tara:strand:- start:407 stop:523 length:117 start_codon:yes stop_codon:yes gene_type:complete
VAAEGGPAAAEQRENQLAQWRRADGSIRWGNLRLIGEF